VEQNASRLYYKHSTAAVKTVWERRSNQKEKDTKCTYNVTFWGVRATIFAAENQ
jgi:hypothetical protein